MMQQSMLSKATVGAEGAEDVTTTATASTASSSSGNKDILHNHSNQQQLQQHGRRALQLLQQVAQKVLKEHQDPWGQHNLQQIPAERIIRHMYDPMEQKWSSDETIVKIESQPFTHGAMRFCYRMKKRIQPPKDATNHHYHHIEWSYAPNYIAKAYQINEEIDTSNEAKQAVQNDIIVQYEAEKWANQFNTRNPPRQIKFIRTYAIEFPNRIGQPWMAVERFIAGHDIDGIGFMKHNTNSGYVDQDLHRITPQVFSAYSFYASEGQRLVADIQGVGDLYTDPQILSHDYRFGEGDLGPRGMALFFQSFHHNHVADSIGIPFFALSKNELKQQQAKCTNEEENNDDIVSLDSSDDDAAMDTALNQFQKMDLNRLRRNSVFLSPRDMLVPPDLRETERQSNVSIVLPSSSQMTQRSTLRASIKASSVVVVKPSFRRTRSEVDDVADCLQRAKQDFIFTHKDFHRHVSGELRNMSSGSSTNNNDSTGNHMASPRVNTRQSAIIRTVSAPLMPTEETKRNLGKVHYQLAVLHGMGRFPEVVPIHPNSGSNAFPEEPLSHDAFSVLFHLSYAAALRNAPACLALARVHAGLDTTVSNLLKTIVPVDFDAAKLLLRRAMEYPHPPTGPRAAAGCLLFHILQDEADLVDYNTEKNDDDDDHDDEQEESRDVAGGLTSSKLQNQQINKSTDIDRMYVLQDTLQLLQLSKQEKTDAAKHQAKAAMLSGSTTMRFLIGDRVEANYALEGTFYPGTVVEITEDGEHVMIVVQYDDDGSTETHAVSNVRQLVPPTATQTSLGGPLSDNDAFGEEWDDQYLLTNYELKAELAHLKHRSGDKAAAAVLYQEAADGAINDGKMKTATEWSLLAAELDGS